MYRVALLGRLCSSVLCTVVAEKNVDVHMVTGGEKCPRSRPTLLFLDGLLLLLIIVSVVVLNIDVPGIINPSSIQTEYRGWRFFQASWKGLASDDADWPGGKAGSSGSEQRRPLRGGG